MTLFYAVILFVLCQRLAELAWSARNTRLLRAAGGVEAGRRHYPFLVALHAGWLAAMLLTIPAEAPARWDALALFGVLQAGRIWVMVTLGRYWTTRIISLPCSPLVRRGPYRFVRHPNYLIVAAEIALLPIAFGAWPVAIVFTLLNLVLLSHRIAQENSVLARRPGWRAASGRFRWPPLGRDRSARRRRYGKKAGSTCSPRPRPDHPEVGASDDAISSDIGGVPRSGGRRGPHRNGRVRFRCSCL